MKRRSRRWFASCRKRWGLRYLQLFDKLEYQFPDRHITLWFWLVESWEGEPWGKRGSREWIAQAGDPRRSRRRMNPLSQIIAGLSPRLANPKARVSVP
jgi:hypothetical protein